MKAVVVYESFRGSCAAVARAIADGIGPGTPALTTAEATPAALAGADLLVVGAPVMALSLPSQATSKVASWPRTPAVAGAPERLLLRSWLQQLPSGKGRSAAFETAHSWSPSTAMRAITHALERAGYPSLTINGDGSSPCRQRFVVGGLFGPLLEGELDRARDWGEVLAAAFAAKA